MKICQNDIFILTIGTTRTHAINEQDRRFTGQYTQWRTDDND